MLIETPGWTLLLSQLVFFAVSTSSRVTVLVCVDSLSRGHSWVVFRVLGTRLHRMVFEAVVRVSRIPARHGWDQPAPARRCDVRPGVIRARCPMPEQSLCEWHKSRGRGKETDPKSFVLRHFHNACRETLRGPVRSHLNPGRPNFPRYGKRHTEQPSDRSGVGQWGSQRSGARRRLDLFGVGDRSPGTHLGRTIERKLGQPPGNTMTSWSDTRSSHLILLPASQSKG